MLGQVHYYYFSFQSPWAYLGRTSFPRSRDVVGQTAGIIGGYVEVRRIGL